MHDSRNKKKNIVLNICGVRILFCSEVPLAVPPEIMPFLSEGKPDLMVPVRIGWMPGQRIRLGQNVYQDYGTYGGGLWLAARMGDKDTSIGTVWRPDFSEVTVWLNMEDFGESVCRLEKIVQYFPMRAFLLRHDMLLLHSSRIELSGSAIAFSGPPQAGKTTQAHLWARYAGARIVSNDRTVIRKTQEGILSTGYPVDGGEPVRDPERIPLAAIVLIEQGEENRAVRLPVSKAFGALMNQTMLHAWDPDFMTKIQLLWANILSDIPVYRLTCTPDERAVICLQQELRRNGGMHLGEDSQPARKESRFLASSADGSI